MQRAMPTNVGTWLGILTQEIYSDAAAAKFRASGEFKIRLLTAYDGEPHLGPEIRTLSASGTANSVGSSP